MKPETKFWRDTVRPNLAPFGILHRIENVVENGMPDVVACMRAPAGNGVSSWIELKHAHGWPPRSPLRFRHFTATQAEWLRSWAMVGGRCCVLAQVGDDYFAMHGILAHDLRAGMTKEQVHEHAEVFGEGMFPTGRIVRWLTER